MTEAAAFPTQTQRARRRELFGFGGACRLSGAWDVTLGLAPSPSGLSDTDDAGGEQLSILRELSDSDRWVEC